MMMALTESSSANFLSCGTICLGEKITPSSSTTAILEPKPENDSSSRPPKLRYTSVNTANHEQRKQPAAHQKPHPYPRTPLSHNQSSVAPAASGQHGHECHLTSKFFGYTRHAHA